MKFLSSSLVIIYVCCAVEKFVSSAIAPGSDGRGRSPIDLYAINYDEVGVKVQITSLGQDLPSAILDLQRGLFLYINEGRNCFVMDFSSKSPLEDSISDIHLKVPEILEKIFAAGELFYATEKLANYDEIGTFCEVLRKNCSANQIWWLSNTKPNLPTAEAFMQSRGMKIAKENAEAQLSKDSENEVRRIRRIAEFDQYYFKGKKGKLFTSENRKKRPNRRRTKKRIQNKNIQNDDHFEGRVVIEDDIPYISPSFSRQDETGAFRHYLGFNDELEPETYRDSEGFTDDTQPATNKTLLHGGSYDENEGRSDSYTNKITIPVMNKKASEFQFPKTIVKDGQVYYRHDLNELENVDKETENYLSKEQLPVVDDIDAKTQFQIFTNDAQIHHSGSHKVAQHGFNLLLDQMRQIGSQTPITSAAIATAAVRRNGKGSSSHVIGAAMNNGYFAAAARGHGSSGTLTQTLVHGSERSSAGSSTVVAPRRSGKAFVRVDQSLGGSSISHSVTQNGEINASAEIKSMPNNSYEDRNVQSFGEASYDDDKFYIVASSEDQDNNILGQILPGQAIESTNMIDNIMEEVYQPNIHNPTYKHDDSSQKDTPFRENYDEDRATFKKGNLITGYTIIDQGGLLVGYGDPPREGEIQQIHQGIFPEGGFHLEEETTFKPEIEDHSINIFLTKQNSVGYDNEFGNYSTEQVNQPQNFIDTARADIPISRNAELNFGNGNYNPSEQISFGSLPAVKLPLTLENGKMHGSHKPLDKNSMLDNSFQQLEDYHQSAHSFPSHLDVDYIDVNQASFPNKQTSFTSYQGQQNVSTKLSNDNADSNINSEDTGVKIQKAFLPVIPIETYTIPEPEPLPISPLAPKNYSAHFKSTTPKNIESPGTTIYAAYDYDAPYYPDYYETNSKNNSPTANHYPAKSPYSDVNQHILQSNFEDNKVQAVPSYKKKILSDLMDKTIPPMSKQKMVTPSTLLLPVIIPENSMDNNDLLQPGEAGSMQTLEPAGPGEPNIKILTLENNDRARVQYQREGTAIQPGEKIPGTPGYRVPPGFRGRVILGHSRPVEVTSKRGVKGYNAQVTLQPHTPQIDAVFGSVSGASVPSQLQGNKTGVYITFSSHSTVRSRQRSLDPLPRLSIANYSRSSTKQLVGPAITKKPLSSGNYDDRTRYKNFQSKASNNGYQANECGYYSNECNRMQGPYQGATICLPIFINVACCC